MRISDWSSDVCSSDLYCCHVPGQCWLTSPSWGTDGQPSTDRILQIWKRSLVPPERGEGRASRSCVSCSRPFRLVRSDPRCGAVAHHCRSKSDLQAPKSLPLEIGRAHV